MELSIRFIQRLEIESMKILHLKRKKRIRTGLHKEMMSSERLPRCIRGSNGPQRMKKIIIQFLYESERVLAKLT